MIKFVKRPVFVAVLVVIAGITYYFYSTRDTGPAYETVTAKKGDILEEVSVTGNVKPSKEVALAFEKSGTVSAVYVDVGDEVRIGETLVVLGSSDLKAQLAQAEANLRVQEIKLEELLKGAREEELKVYEAKAGAATAALNEAKKNSVDKIKDAYTKSDDAVRTKIDQFMENPKSNDPQLKFSIPDTVLETKFEWDRKTIEQVLVSWASSLDALTSYSNLTDHTNTAKANLDQGRSLLDEAASVLSAIVLTTYPTQSTINGWKTDVSSARTNIATATTNLLTAEEKLKTAESNLLVAENELALKRSGATQEQILAQKAEIEKAKANVENFQAQLAKTVLYSPINGIITKQKAKIGEVVAPNVAIVSIISESKFGVEANVPEADIAKVSIASSAKITLDAYGDETIFEARVVAIDPAETIIEGITTYKVTIQFTKDDSRIKSGMTANIDIQGKSQENVIVVPQQAVIVKNGDKIVKVLKGADIQEVKVETGLRGSDGNMAILNGLSEGEEVILFEK